VHHFEIFIASFDHQSIVMGGPARKNKNPIWPMAVVLKTSRIAITQSGIAQTIRNQPHSSFVPKLTHTR